MAHEEKILETLQGIQAQLKEQGAAIVRLEQGQKEQGAIIARLEKGQEALKKQLHVEVTAIAETLHEMDMKLNQLDDHEARIKQLEEDNTFLPH